MYAKEPDIHVYLHLADSVEVKRLGKQLHALKLLGEKIMTSVSDYATEQEKNNARMDASLAGIAGDIKTLTDEVAALKNSSSSSEEDKAKLASLQEKSKALAEKMEAMDAENPEKPADPETPADPQL